MVLDDMALQQDLGQLFILFAALTLSDMDQLCAKLAGLTLSNDINQLRRMFAELTLGKTILGPSLQFCLPGSVAPVFHAGGKTGGILVLPNTTLVTAGKRKGRAEADEEEQERQMRKRCRIDQCEGLGKRKACEDPHEEEGIQKRRRISV